MQSRLILRNGTTVPRGLADDSSPGSLIVGTHWETIAAIGVLLLSIVAAVAVVRSRRDGSAAGDRLRTVQPGSSTND